MRVLLLCTVTFAAGVLFGSLVMTGDAEPPPRPAARRTIESEPEVSRPARSSAGGAAGVERIAEEVSSELDRVAEEEAGGVVEGDGGSITGTVRDAAGQPVAEARVTAVPNGIPPGVGILMRQGQIIPHEDRDLVEIARKAIVRELWRRRSRAVATSGPDGRYELDGLTAPAYRVTAHHDRYDIKAVSSGRAWPLGSQVDFVASPVIETPVEVQLPDGSTPETAWIQWTGSEGRGWTMWSPDAAAVRLPLGPCAISAQLHHAGRTWESEQTRHEVTADPQPVVLVVKSKPVLTVRSLLQDDIVVPRNLQFRLCPVQPGTEPDPQLLISSNFLRVGNKTARDRASWKDLEPGSYLLGAVLGPDLLLAWTVVDFQPDRQEFDLAIPELTTRPNLIVRVVNPAGGLVREGAHFGLRTRKDGRTRYVPHHVLKHRDGTWLLILTGKDLAPLNARLSVTAKPYGSVDQEIRLVSDSAAVIRFQDPARLQAKVTGYAGSGLNGHLSVRISNFEHQIGSLYFRADGISHTAARVQPGRYELLLIYRDDDGELPIWVRSMTLEPGDQDLSIALPALHEVRVRTTGRGTVEIRSSEKRPGGMSRQGRPDADGVVLFRNVAAGSYVVEGNDREIEVRVPHSGIVSID